MDPGICERVGGTTLQPILGDRIPCLAQILPLMLKSGWPWTDDNSIGVAVLQRKQRGPCPSVLQIELKYSQGLKKKTTTKQHWWAVESVRRFLSVSHTYTHTLWKIICGFPKGHNQLITIWKSCWINKIGILFALQENCCGCCCFEKASGKISSSGALTPVMTGSHSKGSLELELGEAFLCSVGDPGGSLAARADAHTPLSTQRGRCCSDFLTFCVSMFVCSFGC